MNLWLLLLRSISMLTVLKNIFYSFSVQLLGIHLKRNLLLTFFWVILVLFISGQVGQKFGIPYLFLDPEYLGHISIRGFFFVGVGYGLFLGSWNLTTYLLNAHHFLFLASLSRPFSKFSFNNGVIPVSFFLFYVSRIAYFQYTYEQMSGFYIFLNISGFTLGILVVLLLYSLYFSFTNRDISFYNKNRREKAPPNIMKELAPGRRGVNLEYIRENPKTQKVLTYLTETFKVRPVRSVAHYDLKMLNNIFRQNHFNVLIFQVLIVLVLMGLGLLLEYPLFRIPAAANVFILFSVACAAIGALTYWFAEWSFFVFIISLLGINFVTSFDFFQRVNKAYGLDYKGEKAIYDVNNLQEVCKTNMIEEDKTTTIQILNNWKAKNTSPDGCKPKMVFIATSGGGLKAAIWAMRTVQVADSLSNGQLMKTTTLITGASGGILGMAYLREIFDHYQKGEIASPYSMEYIENMSKDLLNSITSTMVTNDLLIPWSKFRIGNQRYFKDRGYSFENQLNENTHNYFNKTLGDYKVAESVADIPLMFITPSVINDGRRLIISPQPVSYMMIPPVGLSRHDLIEVDAIDYGWFFKNSKPMDLRFSSALRMNATYPYVLPNVTLPSIPPMEVMDAGYRDNYGILTTVRFIQVFKDWILENTSGVILVQISGSEKVEPITGDSNSGFIEKLFTPISVAGMIFNVQEFEQDNNIGLLLDLLGEGYFDVIHFNYEPGTKDLPPASVSFHITEREKQDVLKSLSAPANNRAMKLLLKKLRER